MSPQNVTVDVSEIVSIVNSFKIHKSRVTALSHLPITVVGASHIRLTHAPVPSLCEFQTRHLSPNTSAPGLRMGHFKPSAVITLNRP